LIKFSVFNIKGKMRDSSGQSPQALRYSPPRIWLS